MGLSLSLCYQLPCSCAFHIYIACVWGGGGGGGRPHPFPQPSHRRSEDCGFNFDHVVGSSLIRNNFLSLRLIRLSSKRFTFRDVLSLVFNSKSKQTQFGNAFRRANNLRFNRAALIRSVLWLRSGSWYGHGRNLSIPYLKPLFSLSIYLKSKQITT